jgi:hypothetical protein
MKLIVSNSKEFYRCECGDFSGGPKCVACGKPRNGKVAEFTFLEMEELISKEGL